MQLSIRQKKYIHILLIISIMFFFRYIPPIGQITSYGMAVLGIFIGCIYGWTIGELGWPSILALIFLGTLEGNTISGIFSSAFGNANLIMVVFCLLFCHGLEKTGLLEVVTRAILSSKFAQKGPWWLCFAFYLATAVASLVTSSNLAVAMICWSIFYETANQLKLEKKSPYVTVVMVGIGIFSYLGGAAMPYNGFVAMCIGIMNSVAPVNINFLAYVVTMLILLIVTIPTMTLFCKYVLRIKIEYTPALVEETTINKKLTSQMKIAIAIIILACLMLLLPSYLPATSSLKALLSNLGVSGTFAVITVLMSILLNKDGDGMLDIIESYAKGVPWGLYLLLAAAMTLSSLMMSESTGISIFLVELLTPVFGGKSPFVIVMLLVTFGIILTNCINNIVCVSLLMPIGYSFLVNAGASEGMIMAMVALLCQALYQGIVMPAGSVVGALLHGNSEWLEAKTIYKYATALELWLIVIMLCIGVPVASFMFNLF